MGFIESTYNSTVTFIGAASQSHYAALAGELGFAARTISIILVILVLINMGTQTRPTEASTSIWLIVKLTLVALFMQNWIQFNAVYLAFDQMFELIGQRLLAVSLGGGETTSFPKALDEMASRLGDFASVTSGRLNVAGAFMNVFMVFLLGVLGAFATLAIIIAKVVLAVLIAIAPLAIVAMLTPATKSFFESWLSAVIMMFMYPLILSGVFATILAMGNATTQSLNANDVNTIGSVIPVVMNVILSIAMVMLSPVILSLVSGSLQVGSVASGIGSFAAKGGGKAISGVKSGARMGVGAYQDVSGGELGKGASGAAQAGAFMGSGALTAAQAMSPANFGNNLKGGINQRAGQLNRMSERVGRFRGK